MSFFSAETSTVSTCMCDTCTRNRLVTEGDYDEYEFLVENGIGLVSCIHKSKSDGSIHPIRALNRRRAKKNSRMGLIGDLPKNWHQSSNLLQFCRAQYVKFTKEQKKYLRQVFADHPFIGVHDRNKNRVAFIHKHLIRMGYTEQVVTRSSIMAWFKNERFRLFRRKTKKQ